MAFLYFEYLSSIFPKWNFSNVGLRGEPIAIPFTCWCNLSLKDRNMHSFVHKISISFRIFGAILEADIQLLWKHYSIIISIITSLGTFVNNDSTSKEARVPEA